MPTLNVTAANTALSQFISTYTTATLSLFVGGTSVATHTLTGFGAVSGGSVTANAIADVTYSGGGTVSSAKLVAGANEITLTVGVSGSGAEVIMTSTTAVSGGTSKILSLTQTMPFA